MNFAGMLAGTLGSIAAANIFGCVMNRQGAAKKIGAPDGSVVPTSAASTFEYYKKDGVAAPTVYHLYADNADTASSKPYKRFIDIAEVWRKSLGLRAVFLLINASPQAIPAEVKTAHDIMDIKKRHAGAFDRPGVGGVRGTIATIIVCVTKVIITVYSNSFVWYLSSHPKGQSTSLRNRGRS